MRRKRLEISAVMPAYLEAENLRLLLPKLNTALSKIVSNGYEVIVVDTTEALDNTLLICEQNGARCIRRRPTNSYGDAVRSGIEDANGEWILFLDADGSHPPEFVGSLWKQRAEADIVIASRYVHGGRTENGFLLTFMSRILNLTYALVLNLRCKDVSNSFRLYRAKILKGTSLQCSNFDIVEEVLLRIMRRDPNTRICEVPFCFRRRLLGKSKRSLFLFILTYIATMARLMAARRWIGNQDRHSSPHSPA
jgi:dolichol-phosphate mannosyltransferase